MDAETTVPYGSRLGPVSADGVAGPGWRSGTVTTRKLSSRRARRAGRRRVGRAGSGPGRRVRRRRSWCRSPDRRSRGVRRAAWRRRSIVHRHEPVAGGGLEIDLAPRRPVPESNSRTRARESMTAASPRRDRGRRRRVADRLDGPQDLALGRQRVEGAVALGDDEPVRRRRPCPRFPRDDRGARRGGASRSAVRAPRCRPRDPPRRPRGATRTPAVGRPSSGHLDLQPLAKQDLQPAVRAATATRSSSPPDPRWVRRSASWPRGRPSRDVQEPERAVHVGEVHEPAGDRRARTHPLEGSM